MLRGEHNEIQNCVFLPLSLNLVLHNGVDAQMKLKHILNPVEYFVVIVHDGDELKAMQSALALEKYGERHAVIESGEIYLYTRRT